MTIRTFAGLGLVLLLAASGIAQDAEFRGSSGLISLVPRQTQKLSGSLGFTLSRSPGYNASVGGAVVQDRLWFFAAGQRDAWQLASPQPTAALEGSWTEQNGRHVRGDPSSSLLTLRFDSLVTGSSFFSANVTRRKGSAATSPFAAFVEP